jgi:hypothetical protein
MSYCSGNGLGFAVAAAAPIAAATGPLAPFVLAGAALATVLPFLPSIGAGRKDADIITPEQNKLGDALAQLDNILRTQTLSASDLQQLDYQLRGIWQTFEQFVNQPALTADGDRRASDGAIATMEPQVQNRLDKIAAMLNAVLGRPNVPTVIQNGGVAALDFRTSSDISFPQAGFAQPGATSPIGPRYIAPVNSGLDTGLLLKLAIAGGLVYVISRR